MHAIGSVLERAWTKTLLVACLALCAAASPGRGEGVADFYKGKTVTLIVGTGPGGGYDAVSRLVARHIGRFIPGAPAVIVTNMPGGGGIAAANILFNKSERDGSVIGMFSNAMITTPLLTKGAARFDPSKFTWLGSVSREDGVCIALPSAGVTSWDDLLTKQLVVGTTAAGTTTYMYPVMLSNLFGAKFKLVAGYPDGGQIVLALERGEVQAVCQTYSSVIIKHPDWIPDGKVVALLAIGLQRNSELPNLKTVMEIARNDEEKGILKLILAPTVAGRPLMAPPGLPADRTEALRAAFATMTKDAAFLADAKRLSIDVDTASGAEIETLVKDIYASPVALVDKAKRAVAEPN
jgi:tripartite-type tricarboxylate transporter receptor subunit TctC